MSGETFTPLAIDGAFVIDLKRFADDRGAFFESWRSADYEKVLGCEPFLQQNLSYSGPNVLRGLHYQIRNPQSQLVTIVKGRVLDVLADLRQSSPTFGAVAVVELDEKKPQQVYMPPGVAHGFQVLEGDAVLHYMCSRYYEADTEGGVRWNDPELGIEWPVRNPLVSERDSTFPFLADIKSNNLPD